MGLKRERESSPARNQHFYSELSGFVATANKPTGLQNFCRLGNQTLFAVTGHTTFLGPTMLGSHIGDLPSVDLDIWLLCNA
jgi:hypothetical protein